MEDLDIPGFGVLRLRHLVCDFNGTLALDGRLLPGVAERLALLAAPPHDVRLHVITADTFNSVRPQVRDLDCTVSILGQKDQDEAKGRYVQDLGAAHVAALGNGRNDRLMLERAALGIAILGGEGAAPGTLAAADVVCPDILCALDLLLHPLRLRATLRS